MPHGWAAADDIPLIGGRDDRYLRREWFAAIQKRVGRTFTLDAFANALGDNALCAQFCSLLKSFPE